jgi:hypothetical protein
MDKNTDTGGAALFDVIVTNEILGNSCQVMTMTQISRFNLCVKMLAEACAKDDNEHSSGMWTVRPTAMLKAREERT